MNLPHQPPMRFIDALTPTGATARFSADHFAVSEGRVTEAALIECVAQTYAATLASAPSNGQPAFGMLAAVTDFQIHARPAAGALLEIEAREIRRVGPLRLITGKITSAGHLIAAGELTVYA